MTGFDPELETVRSAIFDAIEAALAPLAPEVEVEPAGDPIDFPALGITDGGHVALEHECGLTRYRMDILIDGFVEGGGGKAPTRERAALQAAVVAALMADETLGGLIELIEDGDLRMSAPILASTRRLMFGQDLAIQFTTARGNPALPA